MKFGVVISLKRESCHQRGNHTAGPTKELPALRRTATLLLSVFVVIIFGMTRSAASASAQTAPLYQGKTIRIIVGSTTGSLYDRWAHLLAQSMRKHIPGQPKMIVQNMPGAAGLVAANYGYTVAAPDGLTLMMFQRHVYLEQLVERKEVKFNLRRFHWIGSPDKSLPMLYIRADSPYKSIKDILKSAYPPKCGATGTSDLTYSMSKVLDVALGGSVEVVVGFSSGGKIDDAMERGEVVCRATSLAVHFGQNLFRPGTETASTAIFCSSAAIETPGFSTFQRFMSSWSSTRHPN